MNTTFTNGSLAYYLDRGNNPSLRYHDDEKLIIYLARRIEEAITEYSNSDHTRTIVRNLITDLDYRFATYYLWALHEGDKMVIDLVEQLVTTESVTERNQLLYKLALTRLSHFIPSGKDNNSMFVSHLEEVFSQSEQGLLIHLIDQSLQAPLNSLLNDVGTQLGNFIEQQYDFPGVNALVRQGVIKTWTLPDGTMVVSKRNNPHKPDWFRAEQFNREILLSRMISQYQGNALLQQTPQGNVWLAVVRPFAVISDTYSGHYYALSTYIQGTSLEDLLLNEEIPELRYSYLTHYRLLLDALYDWGILWDGLAPRNILVQQVGADRIYHILDFEKMKVLDGPATTTERIVHCRGQIGLEELSIVCTPTEVEACFQGYFSPATWDFHSEAVLSFAPRQEVANILRERGLQEITLGTYNQTDYEIMGIRAPDIDSSTGQRRYPAHVHFKVEHYLSCANYNNPGDYERKTVEILIAAKKHNCFDVILRGLTQLTNQVESAFLRVEFEGLLEHPWLYYVVPPQHTIDMLAHTIDSLYHTRENAEEFRRISAALGSIEDRNEVG